MKKIILSILSLIVIGILTPHKTVRAQEENSINDVFIVVKGYEWGARVPKIIVEFSEEVTEVDYSETSVITDEVTRKVIDGYPSDNSGNKMEAPSRYVALELDVQLTAEDTSLDAAPLVYDLEKNENFWVENYFVSISDLKVISNEEELVVEIEKDAINNRVLPEADLFSNRGEFSGKYVNPLTSEEEELVLQYAAYEPGNLMESNDVPLIIILHGAGEGGTNIESALLGNEVTALIRPEIQDQFTNGDVNGSFVLAVQTPTVWMDEGDNTNGRGGGVSRYTEILMDTINDYVAQNDSIDLDRIYIGGLSNGGYMTINMLLEYPDVFAAGYAIAEAYSYYEYERNEDGTYKTPTETEDYILPDRWLTDEKVDILKNIPLWFVHAQDDVIVNPEIYVLPTYQALIEAGAENAWFSYYENVIGKDNPENQYFGHGSWIYFFNNEVSGVQDKDKIIEGEGFEPSTETLGGQSKATIDGVEYNTIFEWMNDQKK